MPKQFNDCVASGGKVRTVKPSKTKYLHVCYPSGGGPSKEGEVKRVKKKGKSLGV